ncbi:MAG: cytidylate kinase-like family protein [Oscillospiraceae bacterium]|nr:cytidylate kinase-like family protein [Oscillospiraceae bacterium]
MARIITIGREFGSGGRELGRRLAEELQIEYYDREILTQIARHTSLAEEYIQNIVDRQPHNLMPITIGRSFAYVENYAFKQAQSVFQAQSEIIRDMADKSDCVIIGRCADYILRDVKPVRLFVYADMDSRIKRSLARQTQGEAFTEKQMLRQIRKMDKERARYYEFYTGLKWGDKSNYDLCINTTNTEIKQIVPAIAKMLG